MTIPSIENHGEPWFDDGNIILVTQENPTAFKVHRGVLARHSEIFQGMFEMPQPELQPEAADDMVDGCQVVLMYDPPLELSDLIKALYDGASFDTRTINDFFYLAGLLRLSTKYFINHIRAGCIHHLSRTWAYTLKGHDEMVEIAINTTSVNKMTYPYVHPLHVLNLARETNVRLAVPSALYFLSLYRFEDILRADHPKLLVDHPSRPSSSLSPDDMSNYTLLSQWRIELTLDFIRRVCGQRPTPPGCISKGCARNFTRLTSRLSQSWMMRTALLHYVLQIIREVNDDPASYCSKCRLAFREDAEAFRQEAWDSMPLVLGLPPWGELIKAELDNTIA
ncbi:uncharacterized protein EV420DRAFT_1516594 [Desarmillaria tabescens]|uniref:BTB domain-containing protein n=1 Tax=Armillaria tabescens TaxID=1929756 RepID=A0AA39NFG1_ARMTA|nr:uncharacterized protein EV420DRAFT_1516594 [Desarmillaria tabescens]KAK0464483.1 hypothetical protein EV420DRAFT_1516594 [Desarmillaria tabescens]